MDEHKVADEETFSSLLSNIDQWLAENRSEYYAKLKKGASLEQLSQFKNRFNLVLPEAFELLYLWRNGQQESYSASFCGNRMLMSLESITSTKEMLDEMIGTDFEDPEWWKSDWVPFLENSAGDYLCVNLASAEDQQFGQLIEFWHAHKDRKIVFASLQDWAKELHQSMTSGTYKVT